MTQFDFPTYSLPSAVPAWHGTVSARQWRETAQGVLDQGGRLIAMWGDDQRSRGQGFAVHAAFTMRAGLLWITLPVQSVFPGLGDLFPAAERMQRTVFDMLGVAEEGARDTRPWLRHAAWPADVFPLRKDFATLHPSPITHHGEADDYPFVRVEGEGVHEIPVGPVHAGIIEPGHFRFSVLGERVLRLEERLGYTHKGIEKRFEQMPLQEGVRLASRVSGDSTVAYAWAYSMAAEAAAEVTVPARAAWLRALCLERERVANHLGDLGFIGNDAGLAFGLAQFSRLKEDWLRTNMATFGHRYLMDAIIPGGMVRDLDRVHWSRMALEIQTVEQDVARLKAIYEDHSGLQDRFINCGKVAPELAARMGLTGLAGRASGQSWDLRVQFAAAPYDELDVRMATHRNGDVAARVIVRFEEILESLRLLRTILDKLPDGPHCVALPAVPEGRRGAGWVEGWRGEVLIALETGAQGRIARCHPHDPSWQNWPVLEHAVIGNIVPDFPLINKSFNLSYSGHDL
ncbi:MAG TPA: NADH-quinone oxidoreductase subunit C [Burkholderiales bacterium]|nr:NADH-quinone oxidoreductase subunit C [Burkholderiales bacterium]